MIAVIAATFHLRICNQTAFLHVDLGPCNTYHKLRTSVMDVLIYTLVDAGSGNTMSLTTFTPLFLSNSLGSRLPL
jgi:hypothetical protein